jgi:hypothetical protein
MLIPYTLKTLYNTRSNIVFYYFNRDFSYKESIFNSFISLNLNKECYYY